MTDQSVPDPDEALSDLLASAAAFARATIAAHPKAAEIIATYGENIVLRTDLGSASVVMFGRTPSGELTMILGAQQPGSAGAAPESRN